MAQLRLVETHLNFIFSGLLCPVTCESWLVVRLSNSSSSCRDNTRLRAGPPRRSGSRTSRHSLVPPARKRISLLITYFMMLLWLFCCARAFLLGVLHGGLAPPRLCGTWPSQEATNAVNGALALVRRGGLCTAIRRIR